MKKYALVLLAGLAILTGCKDDTRPDLEPVINGSDYYPIQVGDFLIYEVTETYQAGTVIDPPKLFQIKERIDSSYTDLAGEPYFRIVRSVRNTASDSWVDDSVIVVKKNSQRVERLQNNMRKVKLVFPMKLNRTWDINLYDGNNAQNASYTEVAVPYTLNLTTGSQEYPNTTLVQLLADSNLLYTRTDYERYAKNFGLIERRLRDLQYVPDTTGLGGAQISTAETRTERLLERGHE